MRAYGLCQLHVRRWQKHGDPLYVKPRILVCIMDGCRQRQRCQGLCDMHYTRLRRHGDPQVAYVIRGDDEARFWSYVNKTAGCWLWTGAQYGVGAQYGAGYGTFHAKRRNHGAHRYAYELLVGPIPDGLELDHIKANGCTSTLCVKAIADEHGPAHLEPVTRLVNVQRGRGGDRNRGKTHCPAGHPYDEANTYWYRKPNGQRGRICRPCRRENGRRTYRKAPRP